MKNDILNTVALFYGLVIKEPQFDGINEIIFQLVSRNSVNQPFLIGLS